MLIRDCVFTGIDFESAGAEPGHTDVPVQIGLANWSVDKGFHQPWMSYLHTDRDITWGAQRVHGITTDDLRDAPPFLSLWPELKARLGGKILCAHACGTEKRFLRSFPGHGFGPWVDTLNLSKAGFPSLKRHNLGASSEHAGIVENLDALIPEKTWHDALYDAAASVLLLAHYITVHSLEDQTIEHLTQPDKSNYLRNRRN